VADKIDRRHPRRYHPPTNGLASGLFRREIGRGSLETRPPGIGWLGRGNSDFVPGSAELVSFPAVSSLGYRNHEVTEITPAHYFALLSD